MHLCADLLQVCHNIYHLPNLTVLLQVKEQALPAKHQDTDVT
jgi:hypothetical protein